MKTTFFLSLLLFTLLSCEKELIPLQGDLGGVWHLKEVLTDPGDGSGRFFKVTSDKTIQFFEDHTVTSNGNLCDLSIESTVTSTAKYSLVDSSFTSKNCNYTGRNVLFRLQSSDTMLVYIPCFEPCVSKYVKK
jgi:hypothetical protein